MRDLFRRLAERTAHALGSPWAFLLALLTIAVWSVTGPYFKYSDTWQLFINTSTTIVTFLMVFLIQNTQNRETRIVTLKPPSEGSACGRTAWHERVTLGDEQATCRRGFNPRGTGGRRQGR